MIGKLPFSSSLINADSNPGAGIVNKHLMWGNISSRPGSRGPFPRSVKGDLGGRSHIILWVSRSIIDMNWLFSTIYPRNKYAQLYGLARVSWWDYLKLTVVEASGSLPLSKDVKRQLITLIGRCSDCQPVSIFGPVHHARRRRGDYFVFTLS